MLIPGQGTKILQAGQVCLKRFEKKVAEVMLMKKLAIRYGLISKKGKKGKEFSKLFPGCSVSINMHQNYSRHMKATAKLLKRSLRYHHSCKGSLSDASQTPSYHYMDCCPPLAPPPRTPSMYESQIFLSGILFLGTQLSSIAQTPL